MNTQVSGECYAEPCSLHLPADEHSVLLTTREIQGVNHPILFIEETKCLLLSVAIDNGKSA